jgi:hypothetical protein
VDFPHPEGAKNPIQRFENSFEGFSEEVKDRFYRRNFEDMFAGAWGPSETAARPSQWRHLPLLECSA